jgi:hypothetical protein
MRTLREWLGHRDFATTLILWGLPAELAREGDLVDDALGGTEIDVEVQPDLPSVGSIVGSNYRAGYTGEYARCMANPLGLNAAELDVIRDELAVVGLVDLTRRGLDCPTARLGLPDG